LEEPKVGKLFSYVSRSAYAQYIQEKEETGNEKTERKEFLVPLSETIREKLWKRNKVWLLSSCSKSSRNVVGTSIYMDKREEENWF
jgi:hypothetical protein